jgi:hypothetical protein
MTQVSSPDPLNPGKGSHVQPAERLEITDIHSLKAIIARDPGFPERRRRLIRVVIATVTGCAVILVAAGVARLAHPAADPSTPAPIVIAAPPPVVAPTPAVAAAPAEPAPAPVAAPTTGTLHLQRPALPGHVWVDGTKLTTATATVPCGKHRVKVGQWGKTHTIDVACGSDVKVSR